ncbi:TetR/AcrR family transcriptional regulator [Arthrobacter sp. BL-252-APC-1A]|uniref:TetR/AcrR family transcriptional regulator n=1 Tax=Arthrobacter sp. BL-252-APC-1A TaxID=2606622 RepID=UPI0012B3E7BF|nr:TetR/AcrR family transcriptional regulator C-terminal domain-containing protein [Arthrobacter sp. BL-252-APC-1A]MSR97859.1 TetR/AcrR family transcriptional regulator [Arthrobacter sp. BL-252-APC-1A]
MPAARTRRSAGRPSKRVLTRENIAAAALEVITAGGYEGFTMSSLAARLQVAPSALYNHASSKAEVLRWIQDDLMAEVDVACFAELPWNDAVRTWARSYRAVFARHTPLIAVIAVLQVSGAPRTLAMYEAVTEGFLRAGWKQAQIIPAIVALESFIFGSAFDAVAPEDIFDTGSLAGASPLFTAAVAAAPGRESGKAAEQAFEIGLDAMIRGFAGFSGA